MVHRCDKVPWDPLGDLPWGHDFVMYMLRVMCIIGDCEQSLGNVSNPQETRGLYIITRDSAQFMSELVNVGRSTNFF